MRFALGGSIEFGFRITHRYGVALSLYGNPVQRTSKFFVIALSDVHLTEMYVNHIMFIAN